MNPAELAAALDKYAASDLRAAKREGYMLIGQTKVGTVSLTCVDGVYTLTTQGIDAKVLASGKPAAVRPVLAALYQVQS